MRGGHMDPQARSMGREDDEMAQVKHLCTTKFWELFQSIIVHLERTGFRPEMLYFSKRNYKLISK